MGISKSIRLTVALGMSTAVAALTGIASTTPAPAAVGPTTTATTTATAVTPPGMPDGSRPRRCARNRRCPCPPGGRLPRVPHLGHRYCHSTGAHEWTDFLYDDHGALGATVGVPVAGLAPPRGTYVYPAGTAHGNGADIFRLGVAPTATGSSWRVD